MISDYTFSCAVCWDSHPYCESKHKMCGITGNWYTALSVYPEDCPVLNGWSDEYKNMVI